MRRLRQRGKHGSLLVEMAVSLPFIISMGALALNGIFVVMAQWVLDVSCVDAARAAASAPDLAAATRRVEAAVRSHARPGIRPAARIVEFQTFDGDYGRGPYLVLEATATYTMPFPVFAFGNLLAVPSAVELKRLYPYPILPVKQKAP